MNRPLSVAETLNRDCDCSVVDVAMLGRNLDTTLGNDLAASIRVTHPHLFSEVPVFIDEQPLREMQELIAAVFRVIELPGFRAAALAAAPAIAQVEPKARGVLHGFDFHVGEDGPRLIEINTNAGGAMLNVFALGAQPPCCPAADDLLSPQGKIAELEDEFVAMFRREWRLARGDAPLRTIAIVDDDARSQYLYPEFELFRQLFERHGIEARIADAAALTLREGRLWLDELPIDLVYNRVTDFYFEDPKHLALRDAYRNDAAVITPHPRAHALLANKRNLALLTDANFLRGIGAVDADMRTLARLIPKTVLLEGDAERWWRERKQWFFKPAQGFASRGAYRGDKLTRRVFAEILQGGYVAQQIAAPGERRHSCAGAAGAFKVDVRHFVYDGKSQLLAARLYQGQTTNFRTAGGGFAPVRKPRAEASAAAMLAGCDRSS
jgi:hypothetical protein